jgi:hypothetical protein
MVPKVRSKGRRVKGVRRLHASRILLFYGRKMLSSLQSWWPGRWLCAQNLTYCFSTAVRFQALNHGDREDSRVLYSSLSEPSPQVVNSPTRLSRPEVCDGNDEDFAMLAIRSDDLASSESMFETDPLVCSFNSRLGLDEKKAKKKTGRR